MADLVITVASIKPQGDATVVLGLAGAALLQGQIVYREASTSKFKLADSNSGTAEVTQAYGMCLTNSLTDQPAAVATAGRVAMGAILTAGKPYFLSETPGGIEDLADQGAAEVVNQLGLAESTSILNIRIVRPGVTL